MKRLILAACAGLLAAAVASPSFAADLPRPAYKAPIYTAPSFSWSGFYVGVNAGYGWGRSNWTNAVGSTENRSGVQNGVWVKCTMRRSGRCVRTSAGTSASW